MSDLVKETADVIKEIKEDSYTIAEFSEMIGLSKAATRVLVKREKINFKIGGKNVFHGNSNSGSSSKPDRGFCCRSKHSEIS
jgi:hypothetical protein